MRYYNSIYKDNAKFGGVGPNKLLVKIRKELKKGDAFLDLGCGQGKDSFYMSRSGFKVTAVDSSKVAIEQINGFIQKKKITDFVSKQKNIKNFVIPSKKFKVIAALNALQFLPKKDSLAIVEKIKKNILSKGFVVLTSFTTQNPPSKRRRSHFKPGEMKSLFPESHFKIIQHFEGAINDCGHVGDPKPHKHGIVEIVARKK